MSDTYNIYIIGKRTKRYYICYAKLNPDNLPLTKNLGKSFRNPYENIDDKEEDPTQMQGGFMGGVAVKRSRKRTVGTREGEGGGGTDLKASGSSVKKPKVVVF